MRFLISAKTDVGTTKIVNQDSLTVKLLQTSRGQMVFAAVCDGMGGLSLGEVASSAVIRAFDRWVKSELPNLCSDAIEDWVIRRSWESVVSEMNGRILRYAGSRGVRMGTTASVILLTQTRYFVLNVGDSRTYEFSTALTQISTDQSLVAREAALGNISPEQARVDPRRNMLLQCIGASNHVVPDMFFGETRLDTVYMLCSDGFCHIISEEDMSAFLRPDRNMSVRDMNLSCERLIELNKARGERDNISVILVKSF